MVLIVAVLIPIIAFIHVIWYAFCKEREYKEFLRRRRIQKQTCANCECRECEKEISIDISDEYIDTESKETDCGIKS